MFKHLKSLFIIEEEGTDKRPNTSGKATDSSKKESEDVTKKGNQIVKAPTTPKSTNVEPGMVSDKFLKILFQALENNNLEGFDYLEFKKSLKSLSSMPMDEETRYKSAFAMASSMGVTPNKLMETAAFYLNVLKEEEVKFEKALAQQNETKILAEQQAIQQLEDSVKQKAAQIKKLTQEIESLQGEIKEKNDTVSDAKAKVSQTKNNFMASYDSVRSQIETDISNMKKFLGGGQEEVKK